MHSYTNDLIHRTARPDLETWMNSHFFPEGGAAGSHTRSLSLTTPLLQVTTVLLPASRSSSSSLHISLPPFSSFIRSSASLIRPSLPRAPSHFLLSTSPTAIPDLSSLPLLILSPSSLPISPYLFLPLPFSSSLSHPLSLQKVSDCVESSPGEIAHSLCACEYDPAGHAVHEVDEVGTATECSHGEVRFGTDKYAPKLPA